MVRFDLIATVEEDSKADAQLEGYKLIEEACGGFEPDPYVEAEDEDVGVYSVNGTLTIPDEELLAAFDADTVGSFLQSDLNHRSVGEWDVSEDGVDALSVVVVRGEDAASTESTAADKAEDMAEMHVLPEPISPRTESNGVVEWEVGLFIPSGAAFSYVPDAALVELFDTGEFDEFSVLSRQ